MKQHRNRISGLFSPSDISVRLFVGLVCVLSGAMLISDNTHASQPTRIEPNQKTKPNMILLGETLTVVSDDFSVPNHRTAELIVDCPEGYSALNGGVYSTRVFPIISLAPRFSANKLSDQPDGSNPAPTGWRAVVFGDSVGGAAKIAVVCGIRAGVETVVDSMPAWPMLSGLTVDCPPGKVVAGGGIDPVTADEDMIVMASMPESVTSWNGRMWDKTGSRDYKVAVICMQSSGLRIEITADVVDAFSSANLGITCGVDEVVLGGGVTFWEEEHGYTFNSAPFFGSPPSYTTMEYMWGEHVAPSGWEGGVVNENGFWTDIIVTIICEKEYQHLFLPLIMR